MSGGSDPATTTTMQLLSPEQRKILGFAMPGLESFGAQAPVRFGQQTGESTISPFNPQQVLGQNLAVNAAQKQQNIADTALDTATYLPERARLLPQATQNYSDWYGQDLSNAILPTLANTNAYAGNYEGQAGRNFDMSRIVAQDLYNPIAPRARDQLSMYTSGDIWNPSTNPMLQGAIDAATRPMIRSFSEDVIPRITDTAIDRGMYGGSRQEIAEGIAARDLMTAVGDTSSRLVNDQYRTNIQAQLQGIGMDTQAGLATAKGIDEATARAVSGSDAASRAAMGARQDAIMRALGIYTDAGGKRFGAMVDSQGRALDAERQGAALLPSLQGIQTAPAATVSAVGDVQRGMDQARLNERVGNFAFDNYGELLKSKEILAALGMIPGGGSQVTGQPGFNPVTQGLGGALAGAQLGSMIMPGFGTAVGGGMGALLPFLMR